MRLLVDLQQWLAGPAGEPSGLQAWRERVLQGLLIVGLVMGVLVALPSGLLALKQGQPMVPVVDGLALLWLGVLLWRRDWPYRLRAGSVVALIYVLGLALLLTVGTVSQIYLMAFPVMAVLMLGTRPAFMALGLNAVTMAGVGWMVHTGPAMPGLDLHPWAAWLVVAANFTFVDSLITLSVSVLLQGLEVTLQRERRTRLALEAEQQRLHELNESLRLSGAALSRLGDLVLVSEAPFLPDGGRVVLVNRAASERTGLKPGALLGGAPLALRSGLDGSDPESASRRLALREALGHRQPLRLELPLQDAQGRTFWTETDLTPLVDPQGQCGHYVWVHRDITERRAAERHLRESEQRWKLALESAGDGVWDWYPQTGRELFSPRLLAMHGLSSLDPPDHADALDALTHPDDLAAMHQARQDHLAGRTPAYVNEHRVCSPDGQWKWVLTRGMVIERDAQGRATRVIGTHTDITERKRQEAEVHRQARRDSLTGLPNRQQLQEHLGRSLVEARLRSGRFALMFLDLDHFKEVNDTLGHHRGDELLVAAAQRIQDCLAPGDLVARMGGDEFTVVVDETHRPDRAQACGQAIVDALRAPFPLGEERAYVSASVGVARFPQDADALDTLLRRADQALYAAKGAGRNRLRSFTPALEEAAERRQRLANDLRSALEQGQFSVHYQPVQDLRSGRVLRAEALLRWTHPERGPVSPAEFIPVAESTGQIQAIGDWVLDQVLAQLPRWRQCIDPGFQIAVNRSPVEFRAERPERCDWPARIAAADLPGQALVVEITEGLLLDAEGDTPGRLSHWRAQGLQLALDDFGTGYSSLAYLKRYQVDQLKIDRAFVAGLESDGRDRALCRAIIAMAHALDMTVTAEGVENAAQLRLLTSAGCDHAQGHWIAPAMPAQALEEWLWRSSHSPDPHPVPRADAQHSPRT